VIWLNTPLTNEYHKTSYATSLLLNFLGTVTSYIQHGRQSCKKSLCFEIFSPLYMLKDMIYELSTFYYMSEVPKDMYCYSFENYFSSD